MAYEQNPLAYSRTSNMPGLEYSTEDVAQKKRIATNAFGTEPPVDLLDGEFFLKDNDPQDFYRTLYIKRGDNLDKVVTFTDTGKAIYEGINVINLDDDEEVKGNLPLRKLSTGSVTNTNEVSNFIIVDKSEVIKILSASELSKLLGLGDLATQNKANLSISNTQVTGLGALATKDKANLTSDVENILPVANGGTGDNNGRNLLININNLFNIIGFSGGTTYDFEEKLKKYRINSGNYNNIYVLNNQGYNGLIKDLPISQGLDLVSLNLGDNAWTSRIFAFEAHSYETYEYLKRVLATSGSWLKIRNADGTIPAELGGRPNTYTTSAGTWTETYLSTGEIMLEGWGIIENDFNIQPNSSQTFKISLPKTVSQNKNANTVSVNGVLLNLNNPMPVIDHSLYGYTADNGNELGIDIYNLSTIVSTRYLVYWKLTALLA